MASSGAQFFFPCLCVSGWDRDYSPSLYQDHCLCYRPLTSSLCIPGGSPSPKVTLEGAFIKLDLFSHELTLSSKRAVPVCLRHGDVPFLASFLLTAGSGGLLGMGNYSSPNRDGCHKILGGYKRQGHLKGLSKVFDNYRNRDSRAHLDRFGRTELS